MALLSANNPTMLCITFYRCKNDSGAIQQLSVMSETSIYGSLLRTVECLLYRVQEQESDFGHCLGNCKAIVMHLLNLINR